MEGLRMKSSGLKKFLVMALLISFSASCFTPAMVLADNASVEPFVCYSYGDSVVGDYVMLGKTPGGNNYAQIENGTLFVHQQDNNADFGYNVKMQANVPYKISAKIKMAKEIANANVDYISIVLRKNGETSNLIKQKLVTNFGLSTSEWKNFEYTYIPTENMNVSVCLEIGTGLRSSTMALDESGNQVPIQYYLDDFKVLPVSSNDNLIYNGGFDQSAEKKGATAQFGYWNANTNGANAMKTVTNEKHSGVSSLEIQCKTNGYGYNFYQYLPIEFETNRTYKMTYWAKVADASKDIYIAPAYHNSNPASDFVNTFFETNANTNSYYKLTADWKQYSTYIRFSDETGTVNSKQYIVGFMGNKGTNVWNTTATADKTAVNVYVDDVVIEPEDNNMIKDGAFIGGCSGFVGATGNSVITYNDSEEYINVTAPNVNAGIKTSAKIPMVNGCKYIVRFKAKASDAADVGKLIRVRLADTDATFGSKLYPALSTEWQEYSCLIERSVTDTPNLIIDNPQSDSLNFAIDEVEFISSDVSEISFNGGLALENGLRARYSKDTVAKALYVVSDSNNEVVSSNVVLNAAIAESIKVADANGEYNLDVYLFDSSDRLIGHKNTQLNGSETYEFDVKTYVGNDGSNYGFYLIAENAVDENGIIIGATYDTSDGAMDSVGVLNEDSTDFYSGYYRYVLSPGASKKARFFVFESFATLVPLCEAK